VLRGVHATAGDRQAARAPSASFSPADVPRNRSPAVAGRSTRRPLDRTLGSDSGGLGVECRRSITLISWVPAAETAGSGRQAATTSQWILAPRLTSSVSCLEDLLFGDIDDHPGVWCSSSPVKLDCDDLEVRTDVYGVGRPVGRNADTLHGSQASRQRQILDNLPRSGIYEGNTPRRNRH
jgi:hypothetical protein